MDWLDQLVEKWKAFSERMKPTLERIWQFFARLGKSISIIAGYLYKLRAIILAAPVAAVAAILAARNMDRLPALVEVTSFSVDFSAADSILGCLVIGTDYVARDVAVFGPLAVTVGCLLLTMCSKRTLYPWLISLFSLCFPLLIWLTNIYPQ